MSPQFYSLVSFLRQVRGYEGHSDNKVVAVLQLLLGYVEDWTNVAVGETSENLDFAALYDFSAVGRGSQDLADHMAILVVPPRHHYTASVGRAVLLAHPFQAQQTLHYSQRSPHLCPYLQIIAPLGEGCRAQRLHVSLALAIG